MTPERAATPDVPDSATSDAGGTRRGRSAASQPCALCGGRRDHLGACIDCGTVGHGRDCGSCAHLVTYILGSAQQGSPVHFVQCAKLGRVQERINCDTWQARG